MAANLKNEEERLRRIKQVGDYFIETGKSTREISEYFTANFFNISNKTVSKYIHEYKIIYGKDKAINEKIDKNISKSIDDPIVRERVLSSARLALNGYSIKEISKILNKTPKVIERDLSTRLKMYCENDEDMMIYYNIVKKCLQENLESSLDDENIRERILNVARLSLEGYTYEEISQILDISENVIKNDINERLKAYCENDKDMMIYYNIVKKNLENNKLDSLKRGVHYD